MVKEVVAKSIFSCSIAFIFCSNKSELEPVIALNFSDIVFDIMRDFVEKLNIYTGR